MLTPPPIIIISLPNSPRRQMMAAMMAKYGLKHQFWPGIFLSNPSIEASWKAKLGIPVDMKSKLTTGSLGCKIAFLSLFHALSTTEYEYVLILEDDVIMNPEIRWDMLDWRDYIKADYNHLHLLPPNVTCGNQAQLVTNAGLKKLAANMVNLWACDLPIDLMMWHHTQRLAGVTHAAFRDHGNALFRHAVPYLDKSSSERLQINLLFHKSEEDYVDAVKQQAVPLLTSLA